MWYKIAIELSRFWNIEQSNDPDTLLKAFLGVITDSKKRTNDPQKIYNNLKTYKNKLLEEDNDLDQVEDAYNQALEEFKLEFPEFDENENYTKSGDWVNEAFSWLGVPYKFGGDDRDGIDCSSFVQKVFPEKNLPRVASDQQNVGSQVPVDDINLWQPGDRLYFDMTARKGSGKGVADHTGIYLGDNKFIQASSKKGVVVTDLNEYYMEKIVSVMR